MAPRALRATPSWERRAGRRGWERLSRIDEESNVNVVEEFVNLILAQRSYEAHSRVVHAADEMFQTLNQLTT